MTSGDPVILGMLNDSVPRIESTEENFYVDYSKYRHKTLAEYLVWPIIIINLGLVLGFVMSCILN